MLNKIAFFIAISMTQLVLDKNAFSCSCNGFMSVCDSYNSADGVFIGTVSKVEENVTILDTRREGDNIITRSTRWWKMFIQVEKTYKGEQRDEIILASDDSSCGGKFDVGLKLLIYANFNKKKDMWELFYCRRGGRISRANDDLLFFESLKTRKGDSRLSGTLTDFNGQSRDGAKVKIENKSKSYEVVTDRNGVFEIYGLPIDEYKITPEIPLKYFRPIVYGIIQDESLENGKSISVDLKKNSCVGVEFLIE
jgi:hypothetical protein